MIKFVQFVFGKPCKKGDTFQTKFARFVYWNAIVFYFFAVIFFGVCSLFNTVFIPSLVGSLFFPLIFRLVYYMNLKMNGLEKED
ncbi:hypothetical protein [Bacillus cereus group sp. BfR-BA-01380]|uniref:hypothetical protein n=1 Tax=Bacillus cereus group sp. BfR-BA-01380 TaxID=2920324 RepID=UPI001F581AD9|nr:hypothetical protein [Bacillus cereus group sp. BfR-BA-01380]